MNVLVGYASAHGSTAEIAEFIGNILKQRGLSVTVSNVTAVSTVGSYDAFILGSAIHEGMWLNEMSQFLVRFEDELKSAPVAFFITCIRVLEPDGYEHSLEKYVNHRVLNELNVKALTAFAGRLELDAVDWEERWILAARYDGLQPPGTFNNDFRNWSAIEAWATQVAEMLLPVQS